MTDEPMIDKLERCQVAVHEGGRLGGFHPCPNKAKGTMDDGTVACGVHIAAERRRKENRAKERAEHDADQGTKGQAESRCRQLSPYLPDDSARPHYQHSFTSKPGSYTGGVVISASDTDSLLSQLREAQGALERIAGLSQGLGVTHTCNESCPRCIARRALAPNTEGEPGGRCNAYGGTMPDGRVRTCDKSRWHSDSHTYEFVAPNTEEEGT